MCRRVRSVLMSTTGNCNTLVGNYIRVLETGEKLVYSAILYRNYICSNEANTMLVGYADGGDLCNNVKIVV